MAASAWIRRPRNIALVACGLVWLGYTFRGQIDEILANTAGRDFHDYYYSTKAFRFQGASIYDQPAMEALSRKEGAADWVPPYVYPPYLTVVFLPLVGLPYKTVRVLWLVLSYVFLFGSFEATRRLCALSGRRPVDPHLAWLAPIFAGSVFAPLLDHIWYGQSNLLVLFVLSWGIYLERRRPFRFPIGALLLATAGLLKLFPMFLFPGYLAMRRYRTVAALAAWSVALTGLTLLFVPIREFLRFPRMLEASMYVATSKEQFFQDHSASSALRYFVGPAVPAIAIMLVRAVPYASHFALFTFRRAQEGRRSDRVDLLRLAQGFVLLAFVMFRWWEHHLVMLLVPLYVAAYECLRVRPVRLVSGSLVAASAAYIGAVNHPSLAGWIGPHLAPAMNGKIVAQVVLLVVLEVLIWKSRERAPEAALPAPTPG